MSLNRYAVQLAGRIRKRFNEDELKEICFRLAIGYDDLSSSNRYGKARDLVERCEREDRLQDLVDVCESMRPNETWRKKEENHVSKPVFLDGKLIRSNKLRWYDHVPSWGWALTGLIVGVLLMGVVSLVNGGEVGVFLPVATDIPTNLPTKTAQIVPTKLIESTYTLTIEPTNTVSPSPTQTRTPKPTDTPTSTNTPTPTPGINSIVTRQFDKAVMVFIPEGDFTRGSDHEDSPEEEKPLHTVYLDAFWIDQMEVTNAKYTLCVRAGSCERPAEVSSRTRGSYYPNPAYADYPVIYVSWENAKNYCEWVGARLPTEAEWEKVARWDEEAQESRVYPWGEGSDCDHANYVESNYYCTGDTTSVGSYPKGVSLYGTFDMIGNVWEWVADWYDGEYYAELIYDNPMGPPVGTTKVKRGGAWDTRENWTNVAARSHSLPENGFSDLGFRCAQDYLSP